MAYSPGYLLCLLNQGEAIPDYVLARLTGRSYSLRAPMAGAWHQSVLVLPSVWRDSHARYMALSPLKRLPRDGA